MNIESRQNYQFFVKFFYKKITFSKFLMERELRRKGFCKNLILKLLYHHNNKSINSLNLLLYVVHKYHSFHFFNVFIKKNYEYHAWNYVVMTNSSQHRIFKSCVHCECCFSSNAKKSHVDCDDGLVAEQLMRDRDDHGLGLDWVYPNPTQNLYYGYLDSDIC